MHEKKAKKNLDNEESTFDIIQGLVEFLVHVNTEYRGMLQCLTIIHKHKAVTDSGRIQGLMENAGSCWGEATLPEDREEINLRRGQNK